MNAGLRGLTVAVGALLCSMLFGCAEDPPGWPATGTSMRPQPVARSSATVQRPPTAQPVVVQVPAQANPMPPPDHDSAPLPSEIPADLASLPDPVPVTEPRSHTGNSTYSVYGDTYSVLDSPRGFQQRGLASWYGRKFQGRPTSSGEPYDMFKLTAAHRTLPIPCYARVTNVSNGTSVVVRINDRGPFHSGRVIDLSYAAALKLGMLGNGSTPVEVRALDPDDMVNPRTLIASAAPQPSPRARPAPPQTAAAGSPPPAPSAPSAPTVVIAAGSSNQAAAPGVGSPGTALVMSQTVTPSVSGEPLHIATMSALPDHAAPVDSGARFLQAGLFSDPINAATLREQLTGLGFANVLMKSEARGAAFVHRVLIGPFLDADNLDAVRKRLGALQLQSVPVVN